MSATIDANHLSESQTAQIHRLRENQLPSHSVSERSEYIGADQVRDGSGQEGGALLPVARLHRVHHEQRQWGLKDRDAQVGECDGTRGHYYVRVFDQSEQGCALLFLFGHLRLKH